MTFRDFLAIAPRRVIQAVLLKVQQERQEPPPLPEFTLGRDQWTIRLDDDARAIVVRCEEDGVLATDWGVKRERAMQELARATKHHKAASEAYRAESTPQGNKAQAEQYRVKVETNAATIARCEAIISEADAFSVTVNELRFPLSEIA